MREFLVQMMTENDYDEYMCGGYDYHIKKVIIKTNETKEQIKERFQAQYPKMVINVIEKNA